jgi:glucose-1-phosphate cytidylyltransferase
MKVVLFCGGLGLRLRDYSQHVPKPMVRIGEQPLLWHVMKYYAHYGHKDFILCLGYRGDAIKEFFLQYNEALSNDFVMKDGGTDLELHNRDIHDWRITFVDTGLNSNIGERLCQVRKYLDGEEVFLANYSDGLTDLPLDGYLEFARRQDKVACFVSVRPTASFHVVRWGAQGLVTGLEPVSAATHINCGYFVLKREIFDSIKPGDDLVVQPFHRLIGQQQLVTYEYPGFWACADTFKDKMQLDNMFEQGETPWMVWKQGRRPPEREGDRAVPGIASATTGVPDGLTARGNDQAAAIRRGADAGRGSKRNG